MDEPTALDRTFQIIMKQMVKTGPAPSGNPENRKTGGG